MEGPAVKSGTNRIRTTRLERWESLPDLEAAWNDLLHRSPACGPFQSFPWHVCWWRAFGDPHELFVILAYSGSRLVGIAPMMITRERGPVGQVQRNVHFIGSTNHASDYCDFITDPDVPEALDALLEEICASSNRVSRIDLSHFPSHSPNQARTLEYFKSRGMRTTVEFQADAPVRILGDRKGDLKTANKSSLKRHSGFFQKSGDLRFYRCASEAEIVGYLERFFEQHRAKWARTDSPSQFFDTAQQAFYRELVGELFPYGWLRFDVVLFNGAPLAFHFGFEYRRRFIWYKPTYDIQFASRSPGEVLIKFLLEDAIERKLEEFDFTVGSEPFKYRFANRVRSNNRLIVFRSAGDHWIHLGKSVLKKLLKRDAASRGNPVTTQLT
jgi:CelD/BcsL family acetyltransferase involved in cellulose biosynthesis